MHKRLRLLLTSVLLLATTFGCTPAPPSVAPPEQEILDPNRPLKILHFSVRSFMQDFGNVFVKQHPDIPIEVITSEEIHADTPEEWQRQYDQLLELEKPDIIHAGSEITRLIEEGRLLDLEAYIKNSPDIRIDKMNPHVIDVLRDEGEGRLYSLTPDFWSDVLYYNKSMFDEYGIEYPKEGITWHELIELASRFPVKNKQGETQYGLYSSTASSIFSPYDYIDEMANSLNLSFTNAEGNKVIVTSEPWLRVVNPMMQGLRQGSIGGRFTGQMEPGSADAFLMGYAAMSIANIYHYQVFTKSPPSFGWDIVRGPVNPDNPQMGRLIPNSRFAINKDSKNIDKAWTFIAFVTGESLARQHVIEPIFSALSVYEEHNRPTDKNLHAFYSVARSNRINVNNVEFYWPFRELFQEAVKEALDNGIDTGTMLTNLEKRGQHELDKLLSSNPSN